MFTMSTQHRRCRSITSLLNAQAQAVRGVGGMTVLSIMVTAYQVRWNAVRDRIKSHPEEAKQLDEHGRTCLFKALSRRIDDYPNGETIELLVDANRGAVWEGVVDLYETVNQARIVNDGPNNYNNNNEVARTVLANSPLIVASWRRASLKTLQALINARPSIQSVDAPALVSLWNSYREVYNNEQELINLLFEGGRESFAIYAKLHCLLAYCTTPGEILDDWPNGRMLFRAAAAPRCSLQLFQTILQKFPDQIRQQDNLGRLPLHCIMGLSQNEEEAGIEQEMKRDRMKVLLEIHPQATNIRDGNGRLPIHLGIESGWEYPGLAELIASYPQSLSERDEKSLLYPFQLAASVDSSLTTIFKLLQGAPDLISSKIPSNNHHEKARARQANNQQVTRQQPVETSRNKTKANLSLETAATDRAVSDELKRLLHYVRTKDNSELWIELQQLLKSKPRKEWLALHSAVSLVECPIGFLRVLIHMYPNQLRQQDQSLGRTPLHYAAANAKKSLLATTPCIDTADGNSGSNGEEADLRILRLQAIVEAFPAAARIYDNSGQLPLHIAASQGMPPVCLEALIQASPEALCLKDTANSLYPFLLAACSSFTSLNEVFLLLLRAPHVLAASEIVHESASL